MEANQCVGIKSDGVRCSKNAVRNGTRCSVHNNSVRLNGPNALALKELSYIQKKKRIELLSEWQALIMAARNDAIRVNELCGDRDYELNKLMIEFQRERTLLVRQHNAEIVRTGIDPDAEARQRANENRERLDQIRQDRDVARAAARVWGFNNPNDIHQEHVHVQQVFAPVQQPLAALARDDQNLHRSVVVSMVKETIETVLKIPVPQEYRWNVVTTSKTLSDIVTLCKLSPKAVWQFSSKYCDSESIYNLGFGIYGRVMDSVWQFVLHSENKDDLIKIVKSELEDNIGTCAQGNLSRLCNILSGYLDGVGSQESPSEMLGRELSKIMDIEDIQTRLDKAFDLFSRVKLDNNEWTDWLEPLLENGGATSYSIEQVRNDSGNVIALIAVANHG